MPEYQRLLKWALSSQSQGIYYAVAQPKETVPLETEKFGPSEIFTERSSPRSNAAWEALAGPNHENPGFIYVPNWEELKLPPGGVIHGEMMYGISMFHQLHCLGAIRHTFWQLMEGKLDPEALEALDGDTTDPNFIPNGHGLWHIEHCFIYQAHSPATDDYSNDPKPLNWIKLGDDEQAEPLNWI
ncbi:hypothetical protein G4B84_005527 [Aspergillus flavus NRRL3357]|nr:uncharacterized protein G4B84_005527 [Aspergillus flavus NRRL3357]QMW30192.1 hypothetical protein G4B84_005527 [Aspergillus flavus NRRL3357]